MEENYGDFLRFHFRNKKRNLKLQNLERNLNGENCRRVPPNQETHFNSTFMKQEWIWPPVHRNGSVVVCHPEKLPSPTANLQPHVSKHTAVQHATFVSKTRVWVFLFKNMLPLNCRSSQGTGLQNTTGLTTTLTRLKQRVLCFEIASGGKNSTFPGLLLTAADWRFSRAGSYAAKRLHKQTNKSHTRATVVGRSTALATFWKTISPSFHPRI